jgi:transcriptional antiterminator Rof (Rho-off)
VKRQVAEARDNQRKKKKHEALELTMEKNMRLTRLQTCVRVMSTMVLHVLRRKLVL